MKINFKMLWPTLGVLLFAVLSLIAFEAIGYVTGGPDLKDVHGLVSFYVYRLSDFKAPTGEALTIYALAVSGLVLSWVAIILPILGFFFGKAPRFNAALGGIGISIQVIGAILMIASISVFITSTGTLKINPGKNYEMSNVKEYYNHALAATNYVLVIVGMAIAATLTGIGFFGTANANQVKKPKTKKAKASR